MRKSWHHRRPAAFRLDHDHVIIDSTKKATRSSEHPVQVKPDPEFETLTLTVDELARTSAPRIHWGLLFWCALGGLMLLAVGVALDGLITGLFARSQELGWLGLALATIATVSVVIMAVREMTGLMRLATVEKLHQRGAKVIANDNPIEAGVLVQDLLDLTRRMPHLARGRANLEGHLAEIIDGSDMVRLAERELMAPLDEQARKLISVAATRVSIVTALSPRAVIDLLFVFGTALMLVRRLAFLYGVRPGTLGLGRLIRHVVMHLAMTGGLVTSDTLIQQLLGHGVVAKLSARLGEGVLNGLLTARFGLAAIDIIRPLPFTALLRPTLGDLMGEVLGSFGAGEERQHSPESKLASAEVQ
jgi:putative membrane protein